MQRRASSAQRREATNITHGVGLGSASGSYNQARLEAEVAYQGSTLLRKDTILPFFLLPFTSITHMVWPFLRSVVTSKLRVPSVPSAKSTRSLRLPRSLAPFHLSSLAQSRALFAMSVSAEHAEVGSIGV